MNYNFLLDTGTDLISGSVKQQLENNIVSSSFDSFFFFDEEIITGKNISKTSINTQTIVEGGYDKFDFAFQTFYKTDGDYFFITGEQENKAFFDSGLNIINFNSNVIYDKREYSISAIGTGESSLDIQNSLMQSILENMPNKTGDLNSLEYYLNGQKIYSGEMYDILSGNTFFQYTGEITGKIFATPKSNQYEITGSSPDIYGVKFIAGRVNAYLNGMEQPKDNWIELDTGVSMISTGIGSFVSEEDFTTTGVFL